jgi:addiction module HigA family antidote
MDMSTKSASKTITRKAEWLGPAIPPGEILLEEYLKPLGLGQLEAAKRLGISLNRLNEIVLGKRGITADTALRLARLLKPHRSCGCGCRPIGTCMRRCSGRRVSEGRCSASRTADRDTTARNCRCDPAINFHT